jgi:hypothetical protein
VHQEPTKNSVLILIPERTDGDSINDFPDFNAKMITKHFLNSRTFYFYDSIILNGIEKTEHDIEKTVIENSVSITFFVPGGSDYGLSIEFFRRLKNETDVKTVLWVLDDEMIFDTLSKYYCQVFDAVVNCDYYATYAYRKLGMPSLYYFSSYSKSDFHPVEVNKDIDVSFVGDCIKSDRAEYINFLRERGINVEVFGKGSDNGFVNKEDLSEIFSRTKINLNFTKVDGPSVYGWFLEDDPIISLARQNKGRPMEVAMTNSFCLSEYSPSLAVTFEIGAEIDVFYDKEDLLNKVRFYLQNEDARIQIANTGYEKAINVYEADKFIPELLDNLCSILTYYKYAQRQSKIFKNSIFKKNHINKLTSTMFRQLLKLRFGTAYETFTNLFQYGFGIFLISFAKGTKRGFVRMYLGIKEKYVKKRSAGFLANRITKIGSKKRSSMAEM